MSKKTVVQKVIEGLDLISGFLAGKKTFLVALATILSSYIGWKLGVLTPEMAYFGVLGGLGLGSLRSAVNK